MFKEREPEYARRRDDEGAVDVSVGGVLLQPAEELEAPAAPVAAAVAQPVAPAPADVPVSAASAAKRERRRQRRSGRPHGRAR
jgi:hypothetical protein